MRLSNEQLPKALVALYNASRVLGMGAFHPDANKPLTEDEAREALKITRRIDYLRGRPIKTEFCSNQDMDFRLFDRDHGEGAGERAVRKALT